MFLSPGTQSAPVSEESYWKNRFPLPCWRPALLSLQETTRTPVSVFHERRYDPLFNWAFRQIKADTYGPVRSVSARLCSASFPQGDMKNPYLHFGGGALFHDGTHMLDI
jgi:predicted dehydrogenase